MGPNFYPEIDMRIVMDDSLHSFLFDNLFDRWDLGEFFILGIAVGLMISLMINAQARKRA